MRARRSFWLVIPAVLICSAYISVMWVSVPYFQSSGTMALWHSGFTESLVRSNPFQYPPHIALPDGAPIVFGATVSYLEYVPMRLFGVAGLDSYAMVGAMLAVFAMTGCYSLARQLGCGQALALVLSVAFLSQTFFAVHIRGYGATGFGFALLPAFCAIFYRLSHSRHFILSALIMTLVMIFLAFLDGYTFVMAFASGTAIAVGFAISTRDARRQHLTNLGALVVATGVAFTLYNLYVPDAALPGYPLSLFAFLSVHLPSLVWPTQGYSPLFDYLGLSEPRPSSVFVGAYLGNHETVYLTATAIVASVATLFFPVSKHWKITAIFLVIGGLLMAIGPVLPESTGDVSITQLAQGERAPLLPMPTYPLYSYLPGLNQMRATYRWVAVVKLGVWIITCLGCAFLAKRYRYGILAAYGIAILFALEGSSSPLAQWRIGELYYKTASAMQKQLVDDIKEHVPSGSKLLVLPIANDFLLHAIAGKADVRFYNVGGDKNMLMAQLARPVSIQKVSEGGPCILANLASAARQNELDYLVFRSFDSYLTMSRGAWPPSDEELAANQQVAADLSRSIPDKTIVKGRFFWFVDAKQVAQGNEAACPSL